MAEVEIPFTESEIDTNDPSGSAATIVMMVFALAAFFVGSHYAQQIANRVVAIAPQMDDDDRIEVV